MSDTLPMFVQGRHGEYAAKRDAGIAKAEATSGAEWQRQAAAELRRFLEQSPTFHVDLFAEWSRGRWSSKAFGAVVQRAVREGWMEPTDEYRPSVFSNGSAKRVFKSLIHGCGR